MKCCKKFIKFLKKNWKGAILGAVGGYGLILISVRTAFYPLQFLLLPGVLIGGVLFKALTTIGLLKLQGGFTDLAIGIMFITIINSILYALAGAYIQSKYFKR